MNIRNAENKDAPQILSLLSQVLEVHAALRPDLFVSGTTKYTQQELYAIFRDTQRRTFVAVDDSDNVLGYAFCEIRDHTHANNLVPRTELYVDDLCVDSASRGKNVGTMLFQHVQQAARALGCYTVTLSVWTGNDGAKAFYDKMDMQPRFTMLEWIVT